MTTAAAAAPLSPHVPVLLDEVIAGLAPGPGDVVVDATFGAGGYTRALLARPVAHVYAIDRDPSAIAAGRALEVAAEGRLTLLPGRFGDMDALLAERDVAGVDGVAFDVGVSSMQLDRAERGFSFQADGPLDMRMEQAGPSAADVVNTASEAELADIIYHFGDEPGARRVARAIVAARATRPFTRTAELAEVVRRALGGRQGPKDPATRTFQALRIHVNRELDQLHDGLRAAERLLKPGGRLAVVSFHSLEDRAVKAFLRQRSGAVAGGSRHLPERVVTGPAATFARVAKAVRPGDAETRSNPRARSATLRVGVRTDAPAWDD
ncbi:16S rRNA (cytosine(1402)-N(4))-methyltransferase RsmH [Parapedomonas caeni]|jgi:16S rRNA (cytosine1402-N4)-methyltransferase